MYMATPWHKNMALYIDYVLKHHNDIYMKYLCQRAIIKLILLLILLSDIEVFHSAECCNVCKLVCVTLRLHPVFKNGPYIDRRDLMLALCVMHNLYRN